ncbi:MAG TPA: response regulator transcription factor [Phycisphaerae bacterium]|nr:response regulator transcription factor [Phycisphaerae bacterium]
MARILIVEDDAQIADSLQEGLAHAGFQVEHARDGLEGLDAATRQSYDAIVMDLMLPHLDGLRLIERLRRLRIMTPVLILSAKHTVDDRVRGLQTGGDDYLTKPFAFAELVARLQSMLRRASGTAEATFLSVGPLSIDRITREVRRNQQRIELQPREFALLEFLMRNAGRVVSKMMIVKNVWDYNFDPQTNVVEARMCRLREKVDNDASRRLIHTVRGVGYVLRSDA